MYSSVCWIYYTIFTIFSHPNKNRKKKRGNNSIWRSKTTTREWTANEKLYKLYKLEVPYIQSMKLHAHKTSKVSNMIFYLPQYNIKKIRDSSVDWMNFKRRVNQSIELMREQIWVDFNERFLASSSSSSMVRRRITKHWRWFFTTRN